MTMDIYDLVVLERGMPLPEKRKVVYGTREYEVPFKIIYLDNLLEAQRNLSNGVEACLEWEDE